MSDPDAFETCCECGMRFSMPLSYKQWLLQSSRRLFYCPKGHGQHYTAQEDENTKLRRERDRLKQDAARLEDERRVAQEIAAEERRRAAAYKGVATRMKNRVKHGVCPCCNRTFANLASHMKNQHPEFDNVIEMAAKKA